MLKVTLKVQTHGPPKVKPDPCQRFSALTHKVLQSATSYHSTPLYGSADGGIQGCVDQRLELLLPPFVYAHHPTHDRERLVLKGQPHVHISVYVSLVPGPLSSNVRK